MENGYKGHRRASVGVTKSPTDGYGTDDEKKTSRRASLHGPTIRTRRHSCERNSRFKHSKQRRNSRRPSGQGIDPKIVARLSFVTTGSDSSSSSSFDKEDRHHHAYCDPHSERLEVRKSGGRSRSRRPSQRSHDNMAMQTRAITSARDSDSEGSYGVDGPEGRVPDAFGYESDAYGCESDMEKSVSSKLARRRNSAQTIERTIDQFNDKTGTKEKNMLGEYGRDDSPERPLVDLMEEKSSDFEPKSPFRTSPLTISYAAPTEQALRDIARIQLDVCELKHDRKPSRQPTPAEQDAWGMLELNDDFSEPKSSSHQSYGPSLYNNMTAHEEVDKYKQKARRRDSLVGGTFDMEGMKAQVPHFTPAEGCYNASDFLVRCFTARMRTSGFTVLKHNRSRWSKSTHRVLFLRPDGKTLSWRPTDEELGKNNANAKAKHPIIDLRSCLEVRHAWTKDPTRETKRGTAVLRSRLSENHLASKSLSLIFKSRTLDITAFSNDQCKVMMEGFSALCFRLQLRESEDSSNTLSKPPNEDDWASTIYASTSVSMTNTSSTGCDPRTVPSTPWGL